MGKLKRYQVIELKRGTSSGMVVALIVLGVFIPIFMLVQAITGLIAVLNQQDSIGNINYQAMGFKKFADFIIFFPLSIFACCTVCIRKARFYMVIACWSLLSFILECQLVSNDQLDDPSDLEDRGNFCDFIGTADGIFGGEGDEDLCKTSKKMGTTVIILLVPFVIMSFLLAMDKNAGSTEHDGEFIVNDPYAPGSKAVIGAAHIPVATAV